MKSKHLILFAAALLLVFVGCNRNKPAQFSGKVIGMSESGQMMLMDITHPDDLVPVEVDQAGNFTFDIDAPEPVVRYVLLEDLHTGFRLVALNGMKAEMAITLVDTLVEGEVMKEAPEDCTLVSVRFGPNGEMELTYAFSLTENGKDINYRIGDLSYRTLKIINGIEWIGKGDPTGKNGAAFKGWSALVGDTYVFATFEKTAKANLLWLWILLAILALALLEILLYRKDKKNGRTKGGFWKVIRAIGDGFLAVCKGFYRLFHPKK